MPKNKPQKNKHSGSAPKNPEPFYRPFADVTLPKKPQPQAAPAAKPSAPVRRPTRPTPTEPEESLTFERLMAGVTPLSEQGARRVPITQQVSSRLEAKARAERIEAEQQSEQEARARLHALVDEASAFEVTDDGRSIEGRRRGVDGALVRRMRHGELPVDATLDLHGMRVDEARTAVEQFVRDRRAKGDRVVVIVHGRGRNSPANQPVLRGEVSAWLSEGKASHHVSAFLTAPVEHGGEGALCVLLAGPSDPRFATRT